MVGGAWEYLRGRFPNAEMSLESFGGPDLERTFREDTEEFYSAAELEVSSGDGGDDSRCQDERAKLLAFLNERYDALGLPPIGEQRIECYPLG